MVLSRLLKKGNRLITNSLMFSMVLLTFFFKYELNTFKLIAKT